MDGPVIYGADFDGIQRYIFEVPKLVQMVGGSALVREVTERWPAGSVQDIPGAELLHAGGGSLTLLLPDAQHAEDFDASLRGEAERLLGLDPFSSAFVPVGDSFSDAWQRFGTALGRAKAAGRSHPDSGAGALAATCAACASRSALRPKGTPREDEDLCPVCRARHSSADTRGLLQSLEHASGQKNTELNLLNEFSKIAEDSPQRMLGLVVADGNDIGRLVADHISSAAESEAPRALAQIADEIRRRFSSAVLSAMVDTCGPKAACRPIVAGGDDIAIVVPAERAIPLALRLLSNVEASGAIGDRERLRVAAGVCLFKSNYPFYAAHRLAEGALERAKERARVTGTSAIDWHVVQAALSSSLEVTRGLEFTVKERLRIDGGEATTRTVFLTGRPYAVGHGAVDTERLSSVVKALEGEFGDTRRQAVREIALNPAREALLREDLRARLRGGERNTFENILKAHGAASLFFETGEGEKCTLVLDAMELAAFDATDATVWGWPS